MEMGKKLRVWDSYDNGAHRNSLLVDTENSEVHRTKSAKRV